MTLIRSQFLAQSAEHASAGATHAQQSINELTRMADDLRELVGTSDTE